MRTQTNCNYREISKETYFLGFCLIDKRKALEGNILDERGLHYKEITLLERERENEL